MIQIPSTVPPALAGRRFELASAAGRISYYRSDTATAQAPLLLIHSINAAASAYEVRPLYEHYGRTRVVYAPDLPGFGFSERADRLYDPRVMTDALLAIAAEIMRRHQGAPLDALALSLSCEFLARAAVERPELFRTIALVSPTGFDRGTPDAAPAGSTRAMPKLRRILTVPAWRRRLFAALTSRVSMRYFLARTWGSKDIDEGLLEYAYLMSHQPGAENAPYCFVAGFLFSRDIRRVYRALQCPVWMAHGIRGDFTDYSAASSFRSLPNWRMETFPTGALPHFETLAAFTTSYDDFLLANGARLQTPGSTT